MLLNNALVVLISLLIIYILYRINKTRYLKNHYDKTYMSYREYVYTIFSNPEATVLDVLFASIAVVSFAIIVGILFSSCMMSIMYEDYSGFSQMLKY